MLTLPLVQEQYINLQEQAETLAELPGEETEMLLADPQEPTETASSEQDYSVLLVEDNTAIQQYLAGRLRRECVVLTASNGAEALEILHNQAVDTCQYVPIPLQQPPGDPGRQPPQGIRKPLVYRHLHVPGLPGIVRRRAHLVIGKVRPDLRPQGVAVDRGRVSPQKGQGHRECVPHLVGTGAQRRRWFLP